MPLGCSEGLRSSDATGPTLESFPGYSAHWHHDGYYCACLLLVWVSPLDSKQHEGRCLVFGLVAAPSHPQEDWHTVGPLVTTAESWKGLKARDSISQTAWCSLSIFNTLRSKYLTKLQEISIEEFMSIFWTLWILYKTFSILIILSWALWLKMPNIGLNGKTKERNGLSS